MSTTTARTTEPAAHAAITADCKALDLPGSQEFAEPLADAVARQHHTHARYVAELLVQIITAREERASIACGSNVPLQRMGRIYSDSRLAATSACPRIRGA
ncbi:hypothetical protein [Cryobacterium gelidum]|uniref:Uncharacterized protein n=1 Tax=Cryobacterium gelidum TaxID=1259164 RepID=A0A4R9B0Q5_9MICO|nr:hypothetical protein [Cryobacterium gelidum]TFD73622.1 hypothetical protein E3T50_01430 [Cryobacterium gelidum]